jgi:DNA primase
MCRPGPGHCGRSGWLDELDGIAAPTPEQILEWRVSALERKAEEHERRLSALEQMHASTDHTTYHANLNNHVEAVDYWLTEGMTPQTIHDYLLGYCPSCPTAPGYASYTIPVMYQGQLFNIRHRLAKPPNGSKYRPHMAGLPAMIFNADDLLSDSPHVIVLEGEKKSLAVKQETGLANVAIMGKSAFKPEWAGKLSRFGVVYVCYDPDAKEQAVQVARLFGDRGRVMDVPCKADDFFTRYGGTAADWRQYMKQARPI